MVDFSDLICKGSSNFISIRWKLKILETIKILAYFGLTFWPMLTIWTMTPKVIGGWIKWPNLQVLVKFQVNRMKFEDFRKLGSNWPIGLCRPFQSTESYEFQCGTVAGSVTLISENFSRVGWAVWAGGERTNTQTHKRKRSTYCTCQKKKIPK